MAVTVSAPVVQSVVGDKRLFVGTVTFDNSYVTGGEPVTPAQFGFLQGIDALVVLGSRGVQTWSAWYNPATGNLVAQTTADGLQVVNAVDLSTLVVDVLAIGE